MPMPGKGLVKLSEECGELVQIAMKKLNYPDTDQHPDGKGPLIQRLEDEIADVRAASLFVENKLRLNRDRMAARELKKFIQFKKWDSDDT